MTRHVCDRTRGTAIGLNSFRPRKGLWLICQEGKIGRIDAESDEAFAARGVKMQEFKCAERI